MNKWIAEFELEDGDTMPEHMDLHYKGAKIDFHCKPLKTGYWIHHKESVDNAENWECSECHRTTMTNPFIVKGNDYDAMYCCPKCGIKMEVEPQESEKV